MLSAKANSTQLFHCIRFVCYLLKIALLFSFKIISEIKQDYNNLPPQVKTQYLQIQNIVDTSIKRQISDQSISMLKGCIYVCLIE